MPNIDIGTFTFDTAAVQKNLEDTRKSMFELKEEQRKLREEKRELEKAIRDEIEVQQTLLKTSDKQSKEYKKAEQNISSLTKKKKELFDKELSTSEALKKTQKEYRETSKIMENLVNDNKDLLNSQEAVNVAYERENRSIAEARENNKQLLSLRNQLDLSTEEGVVAMEKLNDKLNENNQFIKESVSGYEQQKINIGNYEGAVEGALGPIGEFVSLSQEAGGVMPLLANGLKSAGTAMAGFARSAVAFIATPIGAVLAVLVGAFLLVQNALNRSEESTNKLRKAMAPLSGLFQRILKALEPLGEFIIDGIVAGFEFAEEAFYSFADNVTTGLALLGFDKAAKGVNDFKNEIQETAEASRELAQAESDLEKAQRKQRLTQLEFQNTAEEYRQIRDDESLTIEQRKKANEELGQILNKQLQEEKALAQQALLVANLRIDQEGETKEALDAQYAALTEIADIEERITGQRSEQLQNNNALNREALDLVKERQDAAISQMEAELALFEEQNKFAEDRIRIEQETADREIEILKEKLRVKKLSQTEYETEVLAIQNRLKEAEIERQQEEIQRIEDFEARKKELQDEIRLANAEDELARAEMEAELAYEKQVAELERLQLNEAQKTELLTLIEQNREQVLTDIRTEAEHQRLENFKKVMQEDIRVREQNANAAASIASQLTGILSGLLGDSLAAKLASIAVDAAIQAGLVSISTASSQAQNLAQATAVAPPPLNVPFIAAALGQNAAMQAQSSSAITKILTSAALQGLGAVVQNMGQERSTNIRAESGFVYSRKGTVLRGKRHSQGGIPIEAEDGEPILTRKAFQMFPDLISDINVAGGGIPLAAKGFVSGNTASNTVVQNSLMQRMDLTGITEAVRQGSVEGTREGALEGSAMGTREGSQKGISQLAERRQIQNQSAF